MSLVPALATDIFLVIVVSWGSLVADGEGFKKMSHYLHWVLFRTLITLNTSCMNTLTTITLQ